jgi:DNA-binding transcriptional LysR family regulator
MPRCNEAAASPGPASSDWILKRLPSQFLRHIAWRCGSRPNSVSCLKKPSFSIIGAPAPLTDAIIAAWQRSGCHPRLGQEAPQLNSTLNLVAAGLGVSIVPESLRHLRINEITYLRLTGDGPRAAIGLVSRADQRSAAVEISFPSPAGSRRSTRVSARLRNNAAQIRNAELRDVKRSDWQAHGSALRLTAKNGMILS